MMVEHFKDKISINCSAYLKYCDKAYQVGICWVFHLKISIFIKRKPLLFHSLSTRFNLKYLSYITIDTVSTYHWFIYNTILIAQFWKGIECPLKKPLVQHMAVIRLADTIFRTLWFIIFNGRKKTWALSVSSNREICLSKDDLTPITESPWVQNIHYNLCKICQHLSDKRLMVKNT